MAGAIVLSLYVYSLGVHNVSPMVIVLASPEQSSETPNIFGRDFCQYVNRFDDEMNPIELGGFVHESAQIEEGAYIGLGSVVLEGAKIRKEAHVGNNVIVGVGAWLCRRTFVEDYSVIGDGAIVSNFTRNYRPITPTIDRTHYIDVLCDENQY